MFATLESGQDNPFRKSISAPKRAEIEMRMNAIASTDPTCKRLFRDECICDVCNRIGFTTAVSTTAGVFSHVCANCWTEIALLKEVTDDGIQ